MTVGITKRCLAITRAGYRCRQKFEWGYGWNNLFCHSHGTFGMAKPDHVVYEWRRESLSGLRPDSRGPRLRCVAYFSEEKSHLQREQTIGQSWFPPKNWVVMSVHDPMLQCLENEEHC